MQAAEGAIIDAAHYTAMKRCVKFPCVSLSTAVPPAGVPQVIVDDAAAVNLVATHLLELAPRTLASFVDESPARRNHQQRARLFERACQQHQQEVLHFHGGRHTAGHWSLAAQLRDLAEWLDKIAKPVGILASDDDHAWRITVAADDAGLRVPEDVAVVGFSNFIPLVEASEPTISSVAFDGEATGYAAMKLLVDRMENVGSVPATTLISPKGLVIRASSDRSGIADPLVAEAYQLIRRDPTGQLKVDDLLEYLMVSRTTLHDRMKAALGESPGRVIRRHRLERIQAKLKVDKRPLAAVADEFGYDHVSQLIREFRREFGLTPGRYRTRFQHE